ncbi:MAG TPA: hypothetical protein VGD71_02275 [Kribbella sp.]|jgi:hypothetical protein
MSRTLLLAWSSPSPGAGEAFHQWYEEIHIPQVRDLLDVQGEVRRFQEDDAGEGRYLAIYDLGEGRDAATEAARLDEAARSGKLDMTPAMDVADNPPQVQWLRGL